MQKAVLPGVVSKYSMNGELVCVLVILAVLASATGNVERHDDSVALLVQGNTAADLIYDAHVLT